MDIKDIKYPDMDILTMVPQLGDTDLPIYHQHVFHFEDNKCILHEICFTDNHQKIEHIGSPYLGESKKIIFNLMSHKGWREDPNSY
jgi:hypothetical protein